MQEMEANMVPGQTEPLQHLLTILVKFGMMTRPMRTGLKGFVLKMDSEGIGCRISTRG